MKALIIAISLLALGACASKQPPQPIVIPLQLVNYNPQVIIAPDRPDSTKAKAIEADDTPESALDTLLEFMAEVGAYLVTLEDQNKELHNQNATFKANQTKIKQVLMMSSPAPQ